MGFLDWMKKSKDNREDAGKAKAFLSIEERWALRRMTQQFDDGIVGYKQGGEWEKTFNTTAERLTLRFQDPFGDRPVSINPGRPGSQWRSGAKTHVSKAVTGAA
jgi:hypothetical protein